MANPYHGLPVTPGMRLPAVCRDGVTRTATAGKSCRSNLCAYPGCVVSPVSVQLTVAGKRRTVTGRLELSDAGVISFTADARLSNADLIPLTRFKPYRSKIARRLLSVVYAYNYRNAIRWGHVSDYCEAVGECLKDWSNGDCRETLAGWQGRRELRRLSPGDCRLMSAYMFRVARFKYALGE